MFQSSAQPQSNNVILCVDLGDDDQSVAANNSVSAIITSENVASQIDASDSASALQNLNPANDDSSLSHVARQNDIATESIDNNDSSNIAEQQPQAVDFEPEVIELDFEEAVVLPDQVAMKDFNYDDIAERDHFTETANQNEVAETSGSGIEGDDVPEQPRFLRTLPESSLLQKFFPRVNITLNQG